ncbi:M23 family metallopeptidase [Actinomyces sp. 2119]|uniref:M23 family metallopeptidase n=1 Tax=Actinomyces sp. 2119 TaxID=2321393 RepID=UPI000E6BFFD4|nr:M23 family metallopeptidase [Actinomyces sp. 2119]RJF44915.1 M23 family metallopeptidase [Actinomyces sp. 2119]
MRRTSGALIAAVLVPALPLGLLLGLLLLGGSGGTEAPECGDDGSAASGISIDPDTVPDTTIADYSHDQLVNAAYIVKAGKDLRLTARDQAIGVMTAMGESGLTVIDYGDAAGPDSRGLFQQRDNGAWGTYRDRMDPYTSATNFFKAMTAVEGRDTLEPTIVAHRTQRNADPYHYTRYWSAAVAVVEALSGTDTGLSPDGGTKACSPQTTAPGRVNADGWALPSTGALTSPYGWRTHPVRGTSAFHYGVDLAAGCGAPIWAANDGVVTARGFDSGGNGYITIDHGDGLQTRYLHMYDSGMVVSVGDTVSGGQQIAEEGSSGQSTGCHLHLEVLVNGENVDPAEFMAGVGVNLGQH